MIPPSTDVPKPSDLQTGASAAAGMRMSRGVRLTALFLAAFAASSAASFDAKAWRDRGSQGRSRRGGVALVVSGKGAASIDARLASGLRGAGVAVVKSADFARAGKRRGVSWRRLGTPAGIRKAGEAAGVDGVLVVRIFKNRRGLSMKASLYDRQGVAVFSHGPTPTGRRGPTSDELRELVADVSWESSYGGLDEQPWESGQGEPTRVERRASARDDGGGQTPDVPLATARVLLGMGSRYFYARGATFHLTYGPSSPYPLGGVQLDLFPLGRLGWLLQGLGVQVELVQSSTSSRYADSNGAMVTDSTPMRRLHIDARYKLRLLRSRSYSPTVGVRVGWGISDFQVPRPTAQFIGTRHAGLRLGADVEQPLPWLADVAAVTLGAVYMANQKNGAAELHVYGQPTSSMGIGLRAGLVASGEAASNGLVWGIWGEVTDYLDQFPFDAAAYQSSGGGDDGQRPTTVPHNRERCLAVHASLGYAF